MKEKDIKFSFICLYPEHPEMVEEMADFGCNCYWIKYNSTNKKIDLIKAVFRIRKLLVKIHPDVVHTHLFEDSFSGLLAAKLAKVPMRVITKGDAGYHWHYAHKWVWIDKLNNWLATNIIAISEENKEFILQKEKAHKDKVTMIHHGIPSKLFLSRDIINEKELKERFNLNNKKIIGTISRLIPWKGYQYIVRAAAKVLAHYPDAVFLFTGVGDQKHELLSMSKELGVADNIIFTNWIERKLILSYYSILDVYLHASELEPFGFVIAEAMMSGAIVVSTPTGAAKDAIEHMKNGYLTKQNDADSIAEMIIFVLNNKNPEIGANARKKALELFEFEIMWKNYTKLYES